LLQGNSIENPEDLAEAFKHNASIQHLYLDKIPLGEKGARELASFIEKSTILKEISLVDCGIGAEVICEALRVNRSVVEVDLLRVTIHDASVIGAILKSNSTLRKMRLDALECTCSIVPIGEGLEENASLKCLWLDNIPISGKDAWSLARGIKSNPSLRLLSLVGCSLDNVGLKALAKSLQFNKKLSNLCISDNDYSSIGLNAISRALRVNTTLDTLECSKTLIANPGYDEFLQGMLFNQALDTFWCPNLDRYHQVEECMHHYERYRGRI